MLENLSEYGEDLEKLTNTGKEVADYETIQD